MKKIKWLVLTAEGRYVANFNTEAEAVDFCNEEWKKGNHVWIKYPDEDADPVLFSVCVEDHNGIADIIGTFTNREDAELCYSNNFPKISPASYIYIVEEVKAFDECPNCRTSTWLVGAGGGVDEYGEWRTVECEHCGGLWVVR